MRAYWPKDEYRKLKNRKSARIGRVNRSNKKREEEVSLGEIKDENVRLKVYLQKLEDLCAQKENGTKKAGGAGDDR